MKPSGDGEVFRRRLFWNELNCDNCDNRCFWVIFFSYFWLLAWKLLSLSNFVICFLACKVRKMNYHRMWLLYHSDFVPFLISKEFEIHFRRWSKFWSFSFSSDWSTLLLAKSSTIDYPSKKILAKEGLNCWQKLVQVQGWNKNFF